MPSPRSALALALLATVIAALLAGCMDTPERTGNPKIDLKSADPHTKIIAAQQAATRRDRSSIPQLIDLLGDEEDWVRFNAHMALNTIVGVKDFGYHYLAEPKERAVATQRYRDWYAKTGGIDPPDAPKTDPKTDPKPAAPGA